MARSKRDREEIWNGYVKKELEDDGIEDIAMVLLVAMNGLQIAPNALGDSIENGLGGV